MKTGLVLEGGAMRGIYTAGVLDVFMEQGLPGHSMAVLSFRDRRAEASVILRNTGMISIL